MSVLDELRAGSGRRADVTKSPGQGKRRHRDSRAAIFFMAPWVVGFFVITVGPLVSSLYLAFTNYNLLQTPSFTGLANIERMVGDPRLGAALKVTFTYTLVAVPLQLITALLFAVALDRGLRGLAVYRSVAYLPSLLGGSVAIAVLWRLVFGGEGLFNAFLSLFGITGPAWVSNPSTALSTIVLLHVWTFGAPMVIFLAGLRQIPVMYYEASAIDGANKRQQFFRITIPLLSPIIFFNLVLGIIGSFQTFTQGFIVSGGTGGPSDSTLFYSLYLYQEGFTNFRMGYASALAWFLVIIVSAFTALNFWVSKRWVHYDD